MQMNRLIVLVLSIGAIAMACASQGAEVALDSNNDKVSRRVRAKADGIGEKVERKVHAKTDGIGAKVERKVRAKSDGIKE